METGSQSQYLGLGASSYVTQYQMQDNSHNSGGDDDTEDSRDGSEEKALGMLREQDRFLPTAIIARLMKSNIPKTGKIAKEARTCIQECVSEFISFVTSEAADHCLQEKRKTLNGEDILFAMSALGFDNYLEPLKVYLQKYRELHKNDKALLGGTVAEGQQSSAIVAEPVAGPSTSTNPPVVFAYDLGGAGPTSTTVVLDTTTSTISSN